MSASVWLSRSPGRAAASSASTAAPALRVEIRGIYKDEQGGIKSPRSGGTEEALMGSDFLGTVKEMITVMTTALVGEAVGVLHSVYQQCCWLCA